MTAYYNENDPFAAQWLRELIKAGAIAPGDVDERSIEDVRPDDLRGYTQCHFFAGIGVWSYALRRAGWSDDRPVWTGSCPCQPFSAAGKGVGFADERHLWPAWFHLIGECTPGIVFGEQVASRDGLAWLDLVQADLEGAGYASGAIDLCAAGVGAPHIRQRLWFVAERMETETVPRRVQTEAGGDVGGILGAPTRAEVQSGCCGLADSASRRAGDGEEQRCGEHGLQPQDGSAVREGSCGSRIDPIRMADSDSRKRDGVAIVRGNECNGTYAGRSEGIGSPTPCGEPGGMGDPELYGPFTEQQSRREEDKRRMLESEGSSSIRQTSQTNGFWRDADWLGCRDGKWRPVEPIHVKILDGVAGCVGYLRHEGEDQQEKVDGCVSCVWQRACPKEVQQWRARVSINAQTQEILQQKVHGEGNDEGSVQQFESFQNQSPQSAKNVLRRLREIWTAACPSQGWGPEEQPALQLDDVVCLLSRSRSLAELRRDRATSTALQTLLETIREAGTMQYTPDQVQEIWASIGEKEKDRLRMGFDASRWQFVAPFPLINRAKNRVGRLKGYGNAINAEAARTFIEAYIEVKARDNRYISPPRRTV